MLFFPVVLLVLSRLFVTGRSHIEGIFAVVVVVVTDLTIVLFTFGVHETDVEVAAEFILLFKDIFDDEVIFK